jgi:hypothetical protein
MEFLDLGLERLGQHPPGAFTDQFVDQRAADPTGFISAASSRNDDEHGRTPPTGVRSAGLA